MHWEDQVGHQEKLLPTPEGHGSTTTGYPEDLETPFLKTFMN